MQAAWHQCHANALEEKYLLHVNQFDKTERYRNFAISLSIYLNMRFHHIYTTHF